MISQPRARRGFTLFELLAVLAIVAIVLLVAASLFKPGSALEAESALKQTQAWIATARQKAISSGEPTQLGFVLASSEEDVDHRVAFELTRDPANPGRWVPVSSPLRLPAGIHFHPARSSDLITGSLEWKGQGYPVAFLQFGSNGFCPQQGAVVALAPAVRTGTGQFEYDEDELATLTLTRLGTAVALAP